MPAKGEVSRSVDNLPYCIIEDFDILSEGRKGTHDRPSKYTLSIHCKSL